MALNYESDTLTKARSTNGLVLLKALNYESDTLKVMKHVPR